MKQYRHGDLLIVQVADIPTDAVPHQGRVLAEGEATGHAHVLDRDGLLFERNGELFFRGPNVSITHEEHKRIDLPTGTYQVIRQREYSPEEVRYVVD